MASVVCTAGEEPALVLAKYLAEQAWADAGEEVSGPAVAQAVSEAGSLLGASRTKDLVSLLLTTADTFLPKASAADLECIMALLINLAPGASSAQEVDDTATLIATKLAAAATEHSALKLKLLFLLHNVLPTSSPARCAVLLRAIQAVPDAKAAELVLPNLKRLELGKQPWWGTIGTEQKRQLFKALSTMLRDTLKGKAQKDASACTLKYLGLFSTEEAAANPDVREAAAAAALDFLRTPDVFESDLLAVPAVRALESDGVAQHALVFQLLQVFLTAKLPQFAAFTQANPDALQTLGLNPEDCGTKMRLLSLAAAAADSLSTTAALPAAPGVAGALAVPAVPAAPGVGEIRYAVLQDLLQVKEDFEVEMWVVKAISAGLMEAKMDQMRQTVIVSRSSHRTFGTQQWQELRTRLLLWKENVGSLSKVSHQALAGSGAAVAQGATAVA